jgi:hypothetical protein
MEPRYAITGIKVDDVSHVPNRVDLDVWHTKALEDPKSEEALQVSLFIHALDRLQRAKFDDTVEKKDAQLSYFRIAGA